MAIEFFEELKEKIGLGDSKDDAKNEDKLKDENIRSVGRENDKSDSLAENEDEQDDEEALSFKGQLIRDLVSGFNRKAHLTNVIVDTKRADSEFDKPYRYPEHMIAEQIHMENFEMELLSWKFSGSPWVILQLHGGGFMNALKNNYRTVAGLYSEVGKGAKVLTIDYRVAPEHPYPAALEDAFQAYQWLLEQGYSEKNIILAGDSAGGGLTMSLCHYLKKKGMKLPAGIIAMSPWTDLTASGPSYKEKADVDPVFGGEKNIHDTMIFDSPYLNGTDPKNPCVSPLFGDFTGFPPMLIQVGTEEMLLSDSQQVAQKAKEAGVLVRFTEYNGMFHVFQLAGKVMRESRKAWVEIGKFLEIVEGMSEEETTAE